MKKKTIQIGINTTQRDTIICSSRALEKGDITARDRENILIMASIPEPLRKRIIGRSCAELKARSA